jgi:EAL domain-containing protein (putative c-di-GMP-specific phosphodiesterase class I)
MAQTQFLLALTEPEAFRRHFQRAVAEGQFSFAMQPIVAFNAHALSHHEVFVRFGSCSPALLIERAESLGVIADLDLAVVAAIVSHLAATPDSSTGYSVNLSALSVVDHGIMKKILHCVAAQKFERSRLIFEVTESAEIADLPAANSALQELRAIGCRVCLDDFGAGFASFTYLQALEVDFIKIDGRYVKTADASPRDARLLRAITNMCADLGVGAIAEMIETKEQAAIVLSYGACAGQGYYFGRPQPSPDLTLQLGKAA